MTMEADVRALLETIVAKAWPDIADTGTPMPYATYQQIGGDVINPLDNSAPGTRCAVMQINVYAETRARANVCTDQIEDAMRVRFSARPESAKFCDFDHDMQRYEAQQDFRFWY